MSHIAFLKTQIRDPVALAAACARLGLSPPVQGKVHLFAGEGEGLIVRLPGWTYPAVIEPATGQISYEIFEGNWGDQKELDKLLQAYACEKAKLEARKAGHSVSEQPLADGSIKLTIAVAGGQS